MRIKRLLSFTFCLLFFTVDFFAQIENEKIPVLEIITQLEKEYPFTFSYADEVIEDIISPMPPEQLSFEEKLIFLEQQTSLKFSILENNIVIIQPKINPSLGELQNLKEVFLTNYLTKGITKKTDGSLEIDYQNFGILPGLIEPDVLLTLQNLPGVESVNETVSEINIRGGTHDQNLILWDDIRVYQSGHFFGLISAFNPYQTRKVTLYKNGTNPEYGNSVSGVIAMQTEDEINKDFYSEVGTNLVSAHGFVDLPIGENSSLQFSARNSINKFLESPTYREYYNRAFQNSEITTSSEEIIKADENFNFFDINLRYLWDISDNEQLRINFFNIENNLDFQEILHSEEPESKESKLSQSSLGGGIFYKRQWNSDLKTTAQFYVSSYQLEAQNADILNDQRLIQQNEILETGFKLNSFYEINKNFRLQNGYELLETGISNLEDINNPVFRSYVKEVIVSHSLFSAVQYKSENRSTTLNLGARLNYFNIFDFLLFEPRLTFNQRIFDFFTFEILGEYKSQTTTQIIDFQTDFLGIEKRKWQLANEKDIPLLKSKQISAGLNYNRNRWLISINAYLKKVGGITSQSQGFQNQYQYEQFTGSYFAKGIDFLINKKWDHFSAWASYSLMDNNYTFPDLENKSFPNNVEIRNSLTLAAAYNIKKFKISTGLNWRTGKPFTSLTEEGLATNTFDFEKANNNNLPNYWRVDISASQEFKLDKNIDALMGVSVWNLLDNENVIHSYYQEQENQIQKVDNSALGITPNIVFRIFF